jgi:hypothetical protein
MSIDIPTAHKANIDVHYGQLQPVIDWCERNCQSDWRYIDINNPEHHGAPDRWEFFFESEKDYVAFLMWKK